MDGRTGQTDGQTDESIRVGLGNLRFLQVNGVVLIFSPPCWHHGMAWMVVRVSGQHQKHGASLADDVA